MSTVQEQIDVDVPVSTAYNQWSQFEQFPMFMEGVEKITQLDERHNHWKTKIAGVSREFDTEIVDAGQGFWQESALPGETAHPAFWAGGLAECQADR